MLENLQSVRRRIKKAIDVTLDSLMMTQASLESHKSCQVKLADKNSGHDYSLATDPIQGDVENIFSNTFPAINWKIPKVRKKQSGELRYKGKVDLVEST